MNERSVMRVMLAASSVDVRNDREAAILGGVTRCLITHGHFLPHAVCDAAKSLMDTWRATLKIDEAIRRFPDTSRPTPKEIEPLMRKFLGFYDPPSDKVAA